MKRLLLILLILPLFSAKPIIEIKFEMKDFWSPVEPSYTLWRSVVYSGAMTDVTATETRSGQSNQTITGKRYLNIAAVAVDMDGCTNMTFRNCAFINIDEKAIDGFNITGALFEDCYFEDCQTAIYFSTSTGIVARRIWVKNLQGPPPNRGMAIQFNTVTGSGSIIECFYVFNVTALSDPQDLINLYESHFSSSSPCLVRNCFLFGKVTGTGSFSDTGGGINMEGSTSGSSYVNVSGNVLVRPGQYGISTSGHHVNFTSNSVFSDGSAAVPWSNVGIAIYDYYDVNSCHDVSVVNNRFNWICGNTGACGSPGSSTPFYYPSVGAQACTTGFVNTGNNYADGTLNVDEQPPSCAAIISAIFIQKTNFRAVSSVAAKP